MKRKPTRTKGRIMGARQKLNEAYFIGELFIAGIIGMATGSFTVFVAVLGALVAMSMHSGGIRVKGR